MVSEYLCYKIKTLIGSPLDCKEIQPVHPKGDQSWVFTGRTDAEAETLNTLATWCKELTHLKRPWCWERLRAGGEGDDKRWDGWMASLTQWTWVWVDSGSWLWTGRPSVLWFMGSQRVGRDWATELNWTISSITQSVQLCDPMGCSMPSLPVHHQLPKLSKTHAHQVGDAIQPSHPLSSPSSAFNLSQHQGLFKWISSSHRVAKVLEFQLQHHSFQWIFRTDFL